MRPSILLLLLAFFMPLPAAAALAQVEVVDRDTGRVLTQYRHRGRTYVAGEPGREYEIRLRNPTGQRVLAVASVDGVNVISGQTASPSQSGYVLDPYAVLDVAGWRKSLDHVARFYFTELPDSYAARTGRPDDVGVIGVALFAEKQQRCCWPWREKSGRDSSAPSPASPPSVGSGAAQESGAAEQSRAEPQLGTGHGRSEASLAEYTQFERASDSPDEIVTIWYDSRRNLVAQGVIREPRRYAQRHRPNPFPGAFVPDP